MKREPDITGPVARAWRMNLELGRETKDQEATVRAWLVNGPFHPFWTYWLVCAVHLRPIEGVRPVTFTVPDASHEFMIISLDSPPASEVVPDETDLSTIRHLTPLDCVQQVVGLTDEQAAELCDLIALHASEGSSLDSDYRAAWQKRILDTAAHYRAGMHDATA